MTMSDEKRLRRHKRWQEIGLERVKQDLLDGGHRLVGGPPEVREEAWAWVRAQEDAAKEALSLKPGAWGVSVDLKVLWRKFTKYWGAKCRKS